MKRTAWIFIFMGMLLANIAAIYFQWEPVRFFTKPLIIPALLIYFFLQTRRSETILKSWIMLALLFSWLGDVFLLFEDKDSLYFILGLSSFLVAHIFYIIFFHSIRVRERIGSKLFLLVPVVIYYAFLISLLSPYLGSLKMPVRIYGVVISFMLLLAMHMSYLPERKPGRWMLAGALLFVISDSILAVNKFYHPFDSAGIWIMLTYGLAQWCLVEGSLRYIRNTNG